MSRQTLTHPRKPAPSAALAALPADLSQLNPRDVRNHKGAIRAEARAIIDAADERGGGRTPAEEARLDELIAAVARLEEAAEDNSAGMRRTPFEQPIDPQTGARHRAPAMAEHVDNSLMRSHDGAGLRMEQMFGDAAKDAGGFKDIRQFFSVVASGRHHDLLVPATEIRDQLPGAASHNSYDGGAGGYLVPPAFASMIIDASLGDEIVRPLADVMPMSGPSVFFPIWDSFDRSSDIGGFGGQWLGEGAAMTDEVARFRRMLLTAHKFAIPTRATSEIVQDGYQFANRLFEFLREAVSWNLDYAYLRGTGAGQPLGVLNDPALVTVAKESGQAAATITAANIAKVYARMYSAGHRNAVWLINPTALPQLLTTTFTDGNISTNQVLLQQQADGSFTMMGRPVFVTDKLPTLGTKGDVMFVDFQQYAIGMRLEVNVETSNAPGWQTDEQSFRIKVRTGGQGKWPEAITPKNGDSLSWCVTLATRA